MPQIYPWYELVEGPSLEQGDFLRGCLAPVTPREIDPEAPVAEQAPKPEQLEKFDRVVVLSQSCDLAQGNVPRVMVCPVHTLDAYLHAAAPGAGKSKVNEKKEELKKGRKTAYHLLNRCVLPGYDFPHLVVDFGNAFSIEVAYARKLAEHISRIRLLAPYREHLAQTFARFYMRIGLPAEVDPMP